MSTETIAVLAQSRDVALVISLAGNFLLSGALLKVYKSKEFLYRQIFEMLREMIPAVRFLRDRIYEKRDLEEGL